MGEPEGEVHYTEIIARCVRPIHTTSSGLKRSAQSTHIILPHPIGIPTVYSRVYTRCINVVNEVILTLVRMKSVGVPI
jgi:hypothetical protein